MATEVKIPTPDQTTEEVRIVKWCKAPGQVVNKGEVILEIETDKAVLEVECAASGVLLKQLYAEDDIVPVGTVVGLVGDKGTRTNQSTGATAGADLAGFGCA
jgi:pyruvate dehydrogenase E2 component (dihydrolipoamide acetyltransferase)